MARGLLLLGLMSAAAAYQVALPRAARAHVSMMPKSKKDPRVWLPPRSSQYAREVDVALQLVSRAAAAVAKDEKMATIASQALICDGIASEFAGDTMIAPESAASLPAGDELKAVVELINEIGETEPCVNKFEPPYPVAVKATKLTETELGTTLDMGNAAGVGARTWLLAPVDTSVAIPAISLTLLEFGRPVLCTVALPNCPRNAMSGEKLLRMTVSFDGQSGAVAPPDGTIMWAEKNIGAYERSIAGEHGTDVPIRVDRSLIGKRFLGVDVGSADYNLGTRKCAGVQDLSQTTRCEATARPKAEALAAELGITQAPIASKGPFAYGLVARGEAQTLFELPDDPAADFDSNLWAHAAGDLLVREAGGMVTDTMGNALDFAVKDSTKLAGGVSGVIVTNKDLHLDVMEKYKANALAAAK